MCLLPPPSSICAIISEITELRSVVLNLLQAQLKNEFSVNVINSKKEHQGKTTFKINNSILWKFFHIDLKINFLQGKKRSPYLHCEGFCQTQQCCFICTIIQGTYYRLVEPTVRLS